MGGWRAGGQTQRDEAHLVLQGLPVYQFARKRIRYMITPTSVRLVVCCRLHAARRAHDLSLGAGWPRRWKDAAAKLRQQQHCRLHRTVTLCALSARIRRLRVTYSRRKQRRWCTVLSAEVPFTRALHTAVTGRATEEAGRRRVATNRGQVAGVASEGGMRGGAGGADVKRDAASTGRSVWAARSVQAGHHGCCRCRCRCSSGTTQMCRQQSNSRA